MKASRLVLPLVCLGLLTDGVGRSPAQKLNSVSDVMRWTINKYTGGNRSNRSLIYSKNNKLMIIKIIM